MLVEQYRKNIYTSTLRMVHATVLAEEVLQDIFLKVWLQRSILSSLDNFPAWLNRIARNTMYSAFKRSLKEASVDAEGLYITAPDNAEDLLLNKEYDAANIHCWIVNNPNIYNISVISSNFTVRYIKT